MVKIKTNKKGLIDFSFIPTLECNLHCPHCQYNASLNKKEVLNYSKFKIFINTIDWKLINAIGFYGGEPSINLNLYSLYIAQIPTYIPKFIITNGTWSMSKEQTNAWIKFVTINNFQCFISSTKYHIPYQNLEVIHQVCKLSNFKIKNDDKIIPMGRAFKKSWTCTQRCNKYNEPTRFALMPNGNIIFQNCDGIYPIIQTYIEPFNRLLTKIKRKNKICSKY